MIYMKIIPKDDFIYQAIGEVMFFLANDGELRKHERESFINYVKNLLIFFSDWFNFLFTTFSV